MLATTVIRQAIGTPSVASQFSATSRSTILLSIATFTSSSSIVILDSDAVSSISTRITTTPRTTRTASSTRSSIYFAGPSSFDPAIRDKGNAAGVYNPTTLIACLTVIGLFVLAAVSWFVSRMLRREKNLHAILSVEGRGTIEKQWRDDRPSAVSASMGRRSESSGFSEEAHKEARVQDRGDLHDSVIGVATMSSVPASSSKSAVTAGAYPKLEPIHTSSVLHNGRSGGAIDVGRLMTTTGEPDEVPAARSKVFLF